MTKKGNLFFLIKSLTKTEKRYFKLFCFTQKVGKNYLKLFEAFDNQEVLDEAAIKQQFQGEKFVKQLHVTKNYLSQLILKSLRKLLWATIKNAEIKDCLRNVEILFHKELYDQCHYELLRAEKLARKYEHLTSLIEILGWRRRIFLLRAGFERDQLNEIVEEEGLAIRRLKNANQLWYLTSNVFDFTGNREKEFWSVLKEVEEEKPFLQEEILKKHALFTFHLVNNRPEEGHESLKELIASMEEQPDRIKDDPNPYVTALNNQIGAYVFQKDYDSIWPLLNKVKAVPAKFSLDQKSKFTIRLQLRSYNIELEIYRDTKNWTKAKVLIGEIEEYIAGRRNIVAPYFLIQFWYQFAYVFFMKGDFNPSLKYINEIINTEYKNTREDLISYARLINLMIHFEMENIFVLKYAVDSCRRYFKKKHQIEPFEKVLLKFFSRICNIPKADYRLAFEGLNEQLFNSDPALINEEHLDYFDFQVWIDRHR